MKKTIIALGLVVSVSTIANTYFLPKEMTCKNNVCVGKPNDINPKFHLVHNNVEDGTYTYWYLNLSNCGEIKDRFQIRYFNPDKKDLIFTYDGSPIDIEKMFWPSIKYPGNKWDYGLIDKSGTIAACPGRIEKFGQNMDCPITDVKPW